MKENFTRIAIILDRSGSMESCKESTVAGFNEFIRTQRELPGEAMAKLVQFDDQYETVFDMNLKSCPELTQNTFVPRGSTALLDAQGRTIVELGRELAALPEHERPSKVIMVTLTDGLENASKQYNLQQIGEMIREQRDKYSWDFVFLGANQDAVATAEAMNIPLPSAMSYSTSKAGIMAVMAAVSQYVGAARGGKVAEFSPADRKAAMDKDA
jgi:NAD(P)-dependent dehydrogenase (short-subunit alcohol dehydrogenase family)